MTSTLEIIKTCAMLCDNIYDYEGSAPVNWKYLDKGDNEWDIYWGIFTQNNIDYLTFRGSSDIPDWIHDFEALYNPFSETEMGRVHPGFYYGIPWVREQSLKYITNPVVVNGHSEGAGHTDTYTGQSVLDKNPVHMRVVFGEPRPGDAAFASFISGVKGFSFVNCDANGHDLITDVPFDIWPEEYVHPSPLIKVSESPASNDTWGIFSYHHMQLYLAAINKISPTKLKSCHALSETKKFFYFKKNLTVAS